MDGSLYASLAAFGAFVFVLVIAIGILLIVANWKIFTKAGQPGWATLIPVYNVYVMSQIAFGSAVYFIALIIAWVVSFIGNISGIDFISSLASLAQLVLYIIYCANISKAFQKSVGFTVGLVVLPVIFFPILGFDSSRYIGPQS
ncbi:DUF5684 domain-containing protein [Lacrimispora aerotolerans]|jgi:hypothetical protein|uniref:DUF5684 domain-containing protein n=1 Tax=Lacrimispora aerotolerans TaxID=36832 RepID=UPI000692332E|nr:DUF5684 domain-containing protein [Lacrimispora aerotolerans]